MFRNSSIFKDLHENERKTLETLATEKLAKRMEVLQKSEELKKKYHISEWNPPIIYIYYIMPIIWYLFCSSLILIENMQRK